MMIGWFNPLLKFYMEISTSKTKAMVIAKRPGRCNLELEGKIIQQSMNFNYLRANVSSSRSLQAEAQRQATKAI